MAVDKAYTPEQTASTLAAYAAGKTPTEIAETLGRSQRSVIAKLSKEGVYRSQSTPSGHRRLKKAELVAYIAGYFDLQHEDLESLEKATHVALELLYHAVKAGSGHRALDDLDQVIQTAAVETPAD